MSKVWFITGAGSGIGAAVAEALVKAGATVTIVDIDQEALKTTGFAPLIAGLDISSPAHN